MKKPQLVLAGALVLASVCPVSANHNTTLCLPDAAPAVLSTDSGLHLWARLEEASGTRVDSSAKANDLTAVNSPGNSTDHQEGSFSLDLVKTSSQSLSRASASLAPGFPGNTGGANLELTVAAWVKMKSTANHPLVIKAETTAQRSWSLWIWNFGGGQRVIDPNIFDPSGTLGGGGTDFRGNTVIVTGQWYHVVWTYKGTTGGANDGMSTIYINGAIDAGPFDEQMDTYRQGSNPLRIGFRSTSDFADVLLDEVVILDRALSATEVTSLYENGIVSPTVFCSDSNVCNGIETCNPLLGCQPGMPLGCDDLNVCTDDSCHPVNGCQNPPNSAPCNDGLFCNGSDVCSGGTCTSSGDPCATGPECNNLCDESADNCLVPSGTSCTADGNPCTDDVCDGGGSCGVNNTAPCNDGLFCNGSDVCSGGSCMSPGDPCSTGPQCNNLCDESADNCLVPSGTSCTADGNPCTDDVCDGGGSCGVNNTDPCDDSLFCNGSDVCSGGTCTSSGDPCSTGPECNDLCDESADNCLVPSGTSCTADGNPCTDDVCDGGGSCGVDNSDPCDDGTVCTQVDQCSGGACVGGSPLVCDDGNVCTQDACDPIDGCRFDGALATGCRTAGKSALLMKQKAGSKDKLTWKWVKGQATTQTELADPTDSANYALCLYTGNTNDLLASVAIPADAAKWSPIGNSGYRYNDLTLAAAGIRSAILKGSDKDMAKVVLKGKGNNLPDPLLGSLPTPVTAQLINEQTGLCMEAVYDVQDVINNESEIFKAKANN